ncbi:hypothetical protein CRM22_006790 [Opisthorchis felineus]|uniref:Uncharacterized protein n=1 Tax=Opisthorchis felineus TaxID=147828 RepID=A0A4S2LQS6_OPIFE|nr:hypothetical protein CRM22_006790 [Opisthorchis felineus]
MSVAFMKTFPPLWPAISESSIFGDQYELDFNEQRVIMRTHASTTSDDLRRRPVMTGVAVQQTQMKQRDNLPVKKKREPDGRGFRGVYSEKWMPFIVKGDGGFFLRTNQTRRDSTTSQRVPCPTSRRWSNLEKSQATKGPKRQNPQKSSVALTSPRPFNIARLGTATVFQRQKNKGRHEVHSFTLVNRSLASAPRRQGLRPRGTHGRGESTMEFTDENTDRRIELWKVELDTAQWFNVGMEHLNTALLVNHLVKHVRVPYQVIAKNRRMRGHTYSWASISWPLARSRPLSPRHLVRYVIESYEACILSSVESWQGADEKAYSVVGASAQGDASSTTNRRLAVYSSEFTSVPESCFEILRSIEPTQVPARPANQQQALRCLMRSAIDSWTNVGLTALPQKSPVLQQVTKTCMSNNWSLCEGCCLAEPCPVTAGVIMADLWNNVLHNNLPKKQNFTKVQSVGCSLTLRMLVPKQSSGFTECTRPVSIHATCSDGNASPQGAGDSPTDTQVTSIFSKTFTSSISLPLSKTPDISNGYNKNLQTTLVYYDDSDYDASDCEYQEHWEVSELVNKESATPDSAWEWEQLHSTRSAPDYV